MLQREVLGEFIMVLYYIIIFLQAINLNNEVAIKE